MDIKTAKRGEKLALKGTAADSLLYIADGSVIMDSGAYHITLKKGDIIGIADFDVGVHGYDYMAASAVQLISFSDIDGLYKSDFYQARPDNCRAAAVSINHIVRETYSVLSKLVMSGVRLSGLLKDAYEKYCDFARSLHVLIDGLPGVDRLADFVELSTDKRLIMKMHEGMYASLLAKEASENLINGGIVPGYMLHAASDLREAANLISSSKGEVLAYKELLMNEAEDDLYGRLGDLTLRATFDHPLYDPIYELMEEIYDAVYGEDEDLADIRKSSYRQKAAKYFDAQETDGMTDGGDMSVASQLVGSMNTIFEFCNYPSERAELLKSAVNALKKVPDPFSSDDNIRKLRQTIEENFYVLYLAVLEARIESVDVPVIIRMFLNFGYLDEELAGMDNACKLYNICLTYAGDKTRGVYTAAEWLMAIFLREKEPSINEFDQTFEEYIKEQTTNGRITEAQSKSIIEDRGQKVMFELQNMFRRASKICSGQILAFNPIFCEYQITRSPEDDLIDAHTITEAIDKIKDIDYSLFYRESVFMYSEKENIRDTIHNEVLPDIILMPVAGTRSVMWQEISGKDRQTPARFMFPIIHTENLEKLVLKVLGEYRWEICKRVQGARWNDITEPSLTSLYCDYLQFYRKNSDISQEQKERIKLVLQRCKQNFKEYFVSDYSEYIKYESSGSPRLNKVARGILFTYCPLKSEIINKLGENPIYSDIADKQRLRTGQQLHKLGNIQKKLTSKGQPIPKELEREIAFYRA